MSNVFLKKLVIISTVFAAGVLMILTVDDLGYAENTKSKSGLNFHVPEDWPIEKRGGILGPIPTEEYMVIKFTKVEEEFQAMKADLKGKIEELQISIDNVQANFTIEIQKTQTQTENPVGVEDDLNDMLANLASMETQIGNLDRKITSKVATMKSQSEATATTVKSFEKKIESLQSQIYKIDEAIDYIFEKQENAY